MDIEYRVMKIADYETVYALWKSCPGIGLSPADEKTNIEAFLERNPGASFVALEGGKIVGNVLCGQDGRRGYVYHLAVAEDSRCQGIGTRLLELCTGHFRATGIQKSHLFVFETNEVAIEFYRGLDWIERDDLKVFSLNV